METNRIRWIRSMVGGGLFGLIVSTRFYWVDPLRQIFWMIGIITTGIILGLLFEWSHPWANGEDESMPDSIRHDDKNDGG